MAQHFVGYFGKLPASGDFVVRGLPKELSDHQRYVGTRAI